MSCEEQRECQGLLSYPNVFDKHGKAHVIPYEACEWDWGPGNCEYTNNTGASGNTNYYAKPKKSAIDEALENCQNCAPSPFKIGGKKRSTKKPVESKKVHVLGRDRKVVRKGRAFVLTYKGQEITLTQARELEKGIAKAKKEAAAGKGQAKSKKRA